MNIAFIPVRGGSRSIPLKNIKMMNGKPLVYWTVRAACNCKYIDKVYVSTDSKIIAETVNGFKNGIEAEQFFKMEVSSRSAESATDSASTESAMLEFAEQYDFENMVLIQATSPLLMGSDLDKGFEIFGEEGTDSVLSVVRQKRFHWEDDGTGWVRPTNYDVFHRPRRQEFDGYLVENGAFYITSKENLLKSKNRVSGKIKAVEMNADTFFEIDEPDDWTIIEALMKKNGTTAHQKLPKIQMFLTDCDGCLTDGGMYYSEYGDELKKFNTRDGMGFSLLRDNGIITGIVTGERVDLNRRRAEKLKLDIMEDDCKDKVTMVKKLCSQYRIELENVCFIGDDINDIEVIKMVGFGCCPADAMPQVKCVAQYITKSEGGKGVIREVTEKILRGRNIEQ
ncbi:MAG: N-acylneuraminate cytidylyltransferase [Lachnospiraceae bacterium]|jgi:YrbI family 3-deoxy-D-manno-octulosonate 8-phosphate phosphatase|nr:N-acylneuraminate cytidylyltransferase [Lachnospiraceae bacterium]